eukprot:CAMPEP_0172929234 /NCGR_PEP_ID=MMETSP1075-20121228/218378_1 /TAXON_ID=2916 /ORGANISM="Ceratium fusus, Strain PA161109" /LENGTH=260 /DNA_ID=CAMNT_0013790523 /DNA_START=52 /DNA_END=833 /DNA_ORIENTATION=-
MLDDGWWMEDMTLTLPESDKPRKELTTCCAIEESSPLVGSSHNSKLGSDSSSLAMQSRFRWPPEMHAMARSAASTNLSDARRSSTRAIASAVDDGWWMEDMTLTLPESDKPRKELTTCCAIEESSPLVGSSHNSKLGSDSSSLAMQRRFRWPPEMHAMARSAASTNLSDVKEVIDPSNSFSRANAKAELRQESERFPWGLLWHDYVVLIHKAYGLPHLLRETAAIKTNVATVMLVMTNAVEERGLAAARGAHKCDHLARV